MELEKAAPGRLRHRLAGWLAGWRSRSGGAAAGGGAEPVAALNAAVFESVADGLLGLDRDGRVTFLNRAAQRLSGHGERHSLGRRGVELFPCLAALPAPGGAGGERVEATLRGPAGDVIPIELVAAPIVEARRVTGTVVVFRDIRERRHAEESRRLAAAVVEWSPQAIVVADLAGTVIIVNPAFSRLSGLESADIVGRPVSVLRSGHHDPAFHGAIRQAVEREGLWCGEVWNRHKDGTPYAVWLSITRVSAEAGGGFLVGFYFDITERKRQEARILREANHDPLTGLPNRRMFEESLDSALTTARHAGHRVAVLLIDLDGFKAVNDRNGHDAGDALLCEIARRMTAALRVGDLVARLGGDEFVVLLAPLDAEGGAAGARRVAGHLVEQASRPVPFAGGLLTVSASIGVALGDGDQPAAELIKRADTAMYAVKRSGKRGYRLDPGPGTQEAG
jgi:diguanylate cyclase (GGDEF)-like protein/PAS domain S-box-containing protein